MADPEHRGCAHVVHILLNTVAYVLILLLIIATLLLVEWVGGRVFSLEDILVVIQEFKELERSYAALAVNFLLGALVIGYLCSKSLSDSIEHVLGVFILGCFKKLSVGERYKPPSPASGGKDALVVFAFFLLCIITVLVIDTMHTVLTQYPFTPL